MGKRLRESLSLCLWVVARFASAVATGARACVGALRRTEASAARATARVLAFDRGHAGAEGEPRRRGAPPPRRTERARRDGTTKLPTPTPTPTPRPTPPAAAAVAGRPNVGARLLTHATAVALVCLPVASHLVSPTLRLAARPLAASLTSRGWKPLEQRSTVLAADGSPLAVLHDGVNRRVVPLRDVPEVLRQAVVAAEDKRFWTHGGYDTEAVGRALVANVRAGGVTQGASTITQQLAKQNFVGDEPTLLRKGRELLYAVALEQRFSKEELLERYLNQVYFGSGAYGVAAASEELFDAQPGDLSVEQAALLAGLIRAPAALDPRADPAAATVRRNEVLRAMADLGYLPAGAEAAAEAAPLVVAPARAPSNPEPFVVEAAKRELLANPAFGATEQQRRRRLLTGGLQVLTTVDPRLQAAARATTRFVPTGLGSAIVAVDPASGRIVAVHAGGAAASGQFDVATQGRRQPGSTFKPFAAAAALEAGMPEWQQLAGDGPIELDYQAGLGPWTVDNFGGQDYGRVVLREAVVDSVNTAFAQLGVALGPDRIAGMVQRLGIDVEAALGPPSSRGPSMALGGLTHGVSPLEMASAYATFAAGGVHQVPHLIEQVLGPDGRELYRAQPAPQPVLSAPVNAAMVDILQDAVENGTGWAAALPGWEVLGKTGTSDGPADAWFVGAVPVLSTAVWVGRPGSEEPVPGLTGGSMSAPLWRQFMTIALRGRTPVDFAAQATNRSAVRPLDLPKARPCSAVTCASSAGG